MSRYAVDFFQAVRVATGLYFGVCVEYSLSDGWQTASMRTHPPSLFLVRVVLGSRKYSHWRFYLFKDSKT